MAILFGMGMVCGFPIIYNGSSATLKLVIELIKTPVTDADVSAAKSNITITVNAEPGIWH